VSFIEQNRSVYAPKGTTERPGDPVFNFEEATILGLARQ